jgi:glyoxylase-like metal-dependent hydrolase (beta-lactamase superfamily II)
MNGRGNAKLMICGVHVLLAAIALAGPSPCAGSQPAAPPARAEPTARLQPVEAERYPDLFLWRDACNVYVLRDGESAVLIDLGDGDVLDHLEEIGVKRVDWVLLTHHHREQCRGYPRLAGHETKIAAPAAERGLLEQPNSFRKMKPTLGDRYTVYGSSYVRPPIAPVQVDRALQRMDTFEWCGHEIRCIATPGNSPGGMTYMLQLDGERKRGQVQFSKMIVQDRQAAFLRHNIVM